MVQHSQTPETEGSTSGGQSDGAKCNVASGVRIMN